MNILFSACVFVIRQAANFADLDYTLFTSRQGKYECAA
jgi:hypothetical protein